MPKNKVFGQAEGEQGHERDMAAWGSSTVKVERIPSEPIKNQKKVRRGT